MTLSVGGATQGGTGRRLLRVRLRHLPVIARFLLLVTATGFGLILGFGLGLGLIRLAQAILGDFPTHSLPGFVVVASAYGLTGLAGVAALVIAWLKLFPRPN